VAVRTREDVLAVVSHDLRSPLQTVQLSATMLLTQLAPDPRSRRHLEMIQRACVRMEKLIEDLLDTASIREGRLQLVRELEAVESIFSEAIDLYTPLAAERTIQVIGDRVGLEGIEVSCDRNRILQVIGNLMSNAIKFCRPGDTIRIGARCEGDRVVFSVADSGPGIDAQVLPFVFEPYWSGTGTAKAGAGLGLYIVRGIVEHHGGQVSVASQVGRGTTFTFWLPIA
jgi:signal transduction histidine kinase